MQKKLIFSALSLMFCSLLFHPVTSLAKTPIDAYEGTSEAYEKALETLEDIFSSGDQMIEDYNAKLCHIYTVDGLTEETMLFEIFYKSRSSSLEETAYYQGALQYLLEAQNAMQESSIYSTAQQQAFSSASEAALSEICDLISPGFESGNDCGIFLKAIYKESDAGNVEIQIECCEEYFTPEEYIRDIWGNNQNAFQRGYQKMQYTFNRLYTAYSAEMSRTDNAVVASKFKGGSSRQRNSGGVGFLCRNVCLRSCAVGMQ